MNPLDEAIRLVHVTLRQLHEAERRLANYHAPGAEQIKLGVAYLEARAEHEKAIEVATGLLATPGEGDEPDE